MFFRLSDVFGDIRATLTSARHRDICRPLEAKRRLPVSFRWRRYIRVRENPVYPKFRTCLEARTRGPLPEDTGSRLILFRRTDGAALAQARKLLADIGIPAKLLSR